MSNFSSKIKKLRIENGLTQKQIAESLNVSQNAIYNWENGKREPNLDMIKQIAKYFDFPLYLLLDDNYELDDIALEKKRVRIIGDTEMTEPPKPFTHSLSSSHNYDVCVKVTPETMDELKENAEAREILKEYESDEKILEIEYKSVIDYHNRMIEHSKRLQVWLEWYKRTCEPLNNEGRKKVAEYAGTLAETEKYSKPKERFQGRAAKEEIEKSAEAYLNDDTSHESDTTPPEPPQE